MRGWEGENRVGFLCKFHKKLPKMVLLLGYGAAATGSSSSGMGKISRALKRMES